MKRLLNLILCVLGAVSASASPGDSGSEWIWVHGQLEGEASQKEYLEHATQMFAYYQEHGSMIGRLVGQEELASVPTERLVVIGPIQAFRNIERYGLPLEVNSLDEVTLGGHLLQDDRTGIFLRNENQTLFAYTGLSPEGYRDVFTVPTGEKACTITEGQGVVLFEGEWIDKELILQKASFLDPYPLQEDLKNLVLPEGALVVEPVSGDGAFSLLTPSFGKWLRKFVQGQRVLFFGEGHWNSGVNNFFKLIVEDLLETGDVRAVFFEVNYSFTGFYNYYVTEPDDDHAYEFLEVRLHPLVASSGTLDVLKMLRAWNLAHPEQQVRIGCLDMEWGTWNVARSIINPYFGQLESGFKFDWEKEEGWQHLKELLAEAKKSKSIGEYPFLTPQYIESVITNLWDTREIEDFNKDRQRGIIRNMCEFNGDLLKEGLVLFKGGGWHALKQKPAGETFFRDAAYLNEVFPPTKGKVVTLYAQGLGFQFGEIADLNLNQHMPSATKYNKLLRNFQKALADGRVERDAFYLLNSGGLNAFDSLVAKAGYLSEQDYLRIVSVDWEALTKLYGLSVGQNRVQAYDAIVYILRSGVEVMRPLDFKMR